MKLLEVNLKDLKTNAKLRDDYAFNAIQRDLMSDDPDKEAKAETADKNWKNLSTRDKLSWAIDELEYKMNESKINEGELVTPVFADTQEETNQIALAIWADFVKSLSSIDKEFLGEKDDKPEIAKALFEGIADEANRRLSALEPEPEVEVGSEPPADSEGGESEVPEPQASDELPEPNIESVETDSAELRRFRRLAGIPHSKNYI